MRLRMFNPNDCSWDEIEDVLSSQGVWYMMHSKEETLVIS